MAYEKFKFAVVVLTLGVLFLLDFGCAHRTNFYGDPSSDYHRTLSTLTKRTRLYGLEKVQYETTITYKSATLREAYVNEYAEKYKLTPEEKEALHQRELEEASKYEVFVVSHFATDKETAKIDMGEKTWRVRLVNRIDRDLLIEPDAITNLPASSDPVFHYFHPHVLPWSKNFLVKFPKQDGSSDLVVRMDGISGNLEFFWPRGQN